MSDCEFTRTCLILYFSQDRFKVHGLPSSVEQGNYTVNILPHDHSSQKPLPDVVDIVIFDIATHAEAALAEPFIRKYEYVVNRWISFNWKYPVFDIALKYGLNAMGRRAMNHRRGLHKLMAAIDQEMKRLAISTFEVLNEKQSAEVEFPAFAEVAKTLEVEVTDSQFHDIIGLINPGDHSGFGAAELEKFMRGPVKSDLLTSVIEKVVAKHNLTAGMSESIIKRFGGCGGGKSLHTDVKVTVGDGSFESGLSAQFTVTNQITESENEVISIGELLPEEQKNYFSISFKIRDEVSEDTVREFFESIYGERQVLRSLPNLRRSFEGFVMSLACVFWKYRIHKRRVYVYGIISLPTLFSVSSKKFDSLTPFLDPAATKVSASGKFESQADIADVLANYPASVLNTLLKSCRLQMEANLCESTLRLLELFSTYVVTASNKAQNLQKAMGLVDLLGVGKLDLEVPSVDALPETLRKGLNNQLQETAKELISEFAKFFSKDDARYHFFTDGLNSFVSLLDISAMELRLGYQNLRVCAELNFPKLAEKIHPPNISISDFFLELNGRQAPEDDD